MQQIYQPLVIRCLLDAGGSASFPRIVEGFLPTSPEHAHRMEQTIRKLPVSVLESHGVVSIRSDVVSLDVEPLTAEQSSDIRALATQRIVDFAQARGVKLWDRRLGEGVDDCAFCNWETRRDAVLSVGTVYAIRDRFPVTVEHILVIPKRHEADPFSMSDDEVRDAIEALRRLRASIAYKDPSVSGFNVGANCGTAAGQTVMHAHIHLIPRRSGDVSDPRGGVRGAVPKRMHYESR